MSGAIRPDVAQAIVAAAHEAIVVIDERGIIRSFNAAAERIFGHPAPELLGQDVSRLIPDPHGARHAGCLARHLARRGAGIPETELEVDAQRSDGTILPVELSVLRLEVEGRPQLCAMLRDVSERKQSQLVQARRARVLGAVNRLLHGFVGASSWSRRELFEDALESLLALTGSELGLIGEVLATHDGRPYLKAQALADVSSGAETPAFPDPLALGGLESHPLESLLADTVRTGERVVGHVPAADPQRAGPSPGPRRLDAYLGLPVHSAGRLLGVVGLANRPGGYDDTLVDTLAPFLEAIGTVIAGFQELRTRRKAEHDLYRAQQRLRILAAPDGLTEVPNRQSLMDSIEDAFCRSRELEIPFSVVSVDVDHLERINHDHGRAAGDRVLRHLARLLRETIRPADIIGRYGGERFVMAFLECDEPHAEVVAERLRQRVAGEPFPLDEAGSRCTRVTFSAGVAAGHESARRAQDLVEWADRAACEAKRAGHNAVRIYHPNP